MTRSRFAKLSTFLLVTMLVGLLTGIVAANSSQAWFVGFAGVTTAVAEKNVTYSWSPNYNFNCHSISRTQYPNVNITKIGYNSFSCYVWRDNEPPVGWTRPSGSVNWNNFHHADYGGPLIHVPPGINQRQVVAAGVHDFGHFTGQNYFWNPPLSASGTYRP
jgi:hypothetical protein